MVLYPISIITAIFDKPAFKNVIVTGIVNASDGQKMSKSKGNYSDPNILIDKFGADTLRLYLLSSPVVKAESIKFDEIAMAKLQQNSIVKIYNMALFLTEKISLFIKENPTEKLIHQENLIHLIFLILSINGLLIKQILWCVN